MMDNLVDKEGNSLCWKDCMEMRHTLTYYGFPLDDWNNIWFLNDVGYAKNIVKMNTELKKRFARQPEKRFLVVSTLAGHGMM